MKPLTALLLLALAGCATPQDPAQTVFQARTAQNVALRSAVTYKELTPCQTPPKQPCSDKAVVAQLQKADEVSDKALSAAESAVRSKMDSGVISSAVEAAKAALSAFQSIVSAYGR